MFVLQVSCILVVVVVVAATASLAEPSDPYHSSVSITITVKLEQHGGGFYEMYTLAPLSKNTNNNRDWPTLVLAIADKNKIRSSVGVAL